KSRERLKKLKLGTLLKGAWPFLLARYQHRENPHPNPLPRGEGTVDLQHPISRAAPSGQCSYGGDQVGRGGVARDNQDYIQFHYDLSNDFYELFLDPEMQYSCGYFTEWNNSLERAQQDKLEMICRKLRLAPGEKFLDIGCGWGGLICHAAAKYGVKAHGVTLSQAQFEFARQ